MRRPQAGLLARCAWCALVVLAVSVYSALASAQANFDGVNLGGRTTMMGNAGVARGADGATAFMNPANITNIPGEQFSFSTFALSMGGRRVDNVFDPGGTLDLQQPGALDLSINIVPNTFCLFLDGPPRDSYSDRSRHKYSVCAADTERESFLITANRLSSPLAPPAGASHVTSLRFARSTVALSWGLDLRPGTSMGVTAKVENTRLEDQTSATAFDTIDGVARLTTLNHSRTSSSWDSAVLIGLSHEVSRHVTLGAAFTTPSLHLLGFHQGSEVMVRQGTGERTLVQDDGDFTYNQGGHLRLGLAFSWPRLNFEINGSFYGAQRELAEATFDRSLIQVTGGTVSEERSVRAAITERGKPVANVLMGAEFFIDDDYSIVTGLQTDFSGLHPRTDRRPADTLFRQSKDSVHGSLGVTTYGSAGSLLLGLRTSISQGEILIGDPAQNRPAFVALPSQEWSLSLIVAGQVSFEAVRDAALRAARPLGAIPNALESDGEEDLEEQDSQEPEE